jgi:hypothetical protein
MSNLVFSDKLSLGDAIAAAGKYKSKFKASDQVIVSSEKPFVND